jgi:hypothetical protein
MNVSEEDPLIIRLDLDKISKNNLHSVDLRELFRALQTSPDGISTELAREKRIVKGLNYVNPPIELPALLCCLTPFVSGFHSTKKYNDCIPDKALVKRNGKWITLDTVGLVPGDIIRIAKGERVPCDMRIMKVRVN